MGDVLESVAHLRPVSSPTQAKNQPVSGNKSLSDLGGRGEQQIVGNSLNLAKQEVGKRWILYVEASSIWNPLS